MSSLLSSFCVLLVFMSSLMALPLGPYNLSFLPFMYHDLRWTFIAFSLSLSLSSPGICPFYLTHALFLAYARPNDPRQELDLPRHQARQLPDRPPRLEERER